MDCNGKQKAVTLGVILCFSSLLSCGLAASPVLAQENTSGNTPELNSRSRPPAGDDIGAGMRARVRERLERLHERMGDFQDGAEDASAPATEAEARGGMGRYLQRSENLVRAVSDPQTAIALSALGIRDLFRKQGKVLDAVPVFQGFLAETKVRSERNVYLFLIRQCYKEAGNTDKYLEISRQIIEENRVRPVEEK